LDSIAFIALRRIDQQPSETREIMAGAFLRETAGQRSTVCGGVLYPMKERIKFDRSGGVFDTLYQEIAGQSKDGSAVHARLDVVSSVGLRKFSLGKTIGKVALWTAVTYVVSGLVFYVAFKSAWEDESSW
jgi:hypothetical protein